MNNLASQDIQLIINLINIAPITGKDSEMVAVLKQKLINLINQKPSENMGGQTAAGQKALQAAKDKKDTK